MSSRVVRQALQSHASRGAKQTTSSDNNPEPYLSAHPQFAAELETMRVQSSSLISMMDQVRAAQPGGAAASNTDGDTFFSEQQLPEVDSLTSISNQPMSAMALRDKGLAKYRDAIEEITYLDHLSKQSEKRGPLQEQSLNKVSNSKVVSSQRGKNSIRNSTAPSGNIRKNRDSGNSERNRNQSQSKKASSPKKNYGVSNEKQGSVPLQAQAEVSMADVTYPASKFLQEELDQVSHLGPLLESKINDIRQRTESQVDELNSKLSYMIQHYTSMADVSRNVGVSSLVRNQTTSKSVSSTLPFDFEVLHAELDEIEEAKRRTDHRISSSLQPRAGEQRLSVTKQNVHVHVHQVDMDARLRKVSNDIQELVRNGGSSLLLGKVQDAKSRQSSHVRTGGSPPSFANRTGNRKGNSGERQHKLANDLGELLRVPGHRWPRNRVIRREQVPQKHLRETVQRRYPNQVMEQVDVKDQRTTTYQKQYSVSDSQRKRSNDSRRTMQPQTKPSQRNHAVQTHIETENVNTQTDSSLEPPQNIATSISVSSQQPLQEQILNDARETQQHCFESIEWYYSIASMLVDRVVSEHGNAFQCAVTLSLRAAVVTLTQLKPAVDQGHVSHAALGRVLGATIATVFLHTYWLLLSFTVHGAICAVATDHQQFASICAPHLERVVFGSLSTSEFVFHQTPVGLIALIAAVTYKHTTKQSLSLESQQTLASFLDEHAGSSERTTNTMQAAIHAATGTFYAVHGSGSESSAVSATRSAMAALDGSFRKVNNAPDFVSLGAVVLLGLFRTRGVRGIDGEHQTSVSLGVHEFAKQSGVPIGVADSCALTATLTALCDACEIATSIVKGEDYVVEVPQVVDGERIKEDVSQHRDIVASLKHELVLSNDLYSIVEYVAAGILSRKRSLLCGWYPSVVPKELEKSSCIEIVEDAVQVVGSSNLGLEFKTLTHHCHALFDAIKSKALQRIASRSSTTIRAEPKSEPLLLRNPARNAMLSSAALAQLLAEQPVLVRDSSSDDETFRNAIKEWFLSRGESIESEVLDSLVQLLKDKNVSDDDSEVDRIRVAQQSNRRELWKENDDKEIVQRWSQEGLLSVVLRMYRDSSATVTDGAEEEQQISDSPEISETVSKVESPPGDNTESSLVENCSTELVAVEMVDAQVQVELETHSTSQVESVEHESAVVSKVTAPRNMQTGPSQETLDMIEVAKKQQEWIAQTLSDQHNERKRQQQQDQSRLQAREKALEDSQLAWARTKQEHMKEEIEELDQRMVRREELHHSLLVESTTAHTKLISDVCGSIKQAIDALPSALSSITATAASQQQHIVRVEPQVVYKEPELPAPSLPVEPPVQVESSHDPHQERHLMMNEDLTVQAINRLWNQEREPKKKTIRNDYTPDEQLITKVKLDKMPTMLDWSDSEQDDDNQSETYSNPDLSDGELDVDPGEYSDGQIVLDSTPVVYHRP